MTTYANWVAKTAGLLEEEFGVERGDRVLLDLPPHWLGPILLGAVWSLGAVVLPAPADIATSAPLLVVCGPEALPTYAESGLPVLASALAPLGRRFADPLPSGVRDLGVEVWSQPDAFVAAEPPEGDDEAIAGRTHADLFAAPATEAAERLLTTDNPVSTEGAIGFARLLASGGSLVLVRRAEAGAWEGHARDERVTTRQAPPGP